MRARRTDLEKAIAAHGGPAAVADRLGWRLKAKSRKPRGYWDSLPNVRQEVDEFAEDNGLPLGERCQPACLPACRTAASLPEPAPAAGARNAAGVAERSHLC